ncbi:MAG: hypothetical protein KatS3mg083_162 [Candidatus Dojkabacteria bacterium]|nr:MAG: hypothetical protein KatS3mg083_162 [Candidatus Dojkabacteria bacterium]
MLKEIRCDKFAPNHQVIKLNEGLNTVLGSSSGTNAIGKINISVGYRLCIRR